MSSSLGQKHGLQGKSWSRSSVENDVTGACIVAPEVMRKLIQKYQLQAPRYTSYPTVPYWENNVSVEDWKKTVLQIFSSKDGLGGLSIYIHLPYCESLCTYCACNTRITVNHGVEEPYIRAVMKEWDMWLSMFQKKPRIMEVHLGGGTPTFFSPQNLSLLLNHIKHNSFVDSKAVFSFEAHPNYTSREHLQTLYDIGFRRVSFGIQDFDFKVQDAINRLQSFDVVQTCVFQAREIGYGSINFDLVYGLPFQTTQGLQKTLLQVGQLRPDTIAFYSYAHVPWMKPGQRKFTEYDLPDVFERAELFRLGSAYLRDQGYKTIGMDHFSLPQDELYKSLENRTLRRNFMGYTQQNSTMLIGLGVSAISDASEAYAQNYKTVEQYLDSVNQGRLPFWKGHLCSREDQVIRKHIQNIMCYLQTSWGNLCTYFDAFDEVELRLLELEKDGLIKLADHTLTVTDLGRHFLRNIALAFDLRYWKDTPEKPTFSKTV